MPHEIGSGWLRGSRDGVESLINEKDVFSGYCLAWAGRGAGVGDGWDMGLAESRSAPARI